MSAEQEPESDQDENSQAEDIFLETEGRWYVFLSLLKPRTTIALSGLLGVVAAVLFTLVLFPQVTSVLALGLVITAAVGLLIGLEVAIVLNLLLKDEVVKDAGMRRTLMWFAILLAPISIAALALTLALGVAPGLLFLSGPAGWVALGLVSAVIGLLALAGVFALASTAGTKTRGAEAWQEFKTVLSDFYKGPDLQPSKDLDPLFTKEFDPKSLDSTIENLEADLKLPLTPKTPVEPIKIMVIGSQSSGKTALVQKFTADYSQGNEATIGMELYLKKIDGLLPLRIQDTAGDISYRSIVETYYKDLTGYKGPDAMMLAYDINDKSSLEALHGFLPKLVEDLPKGRPMMLVACKNDAKPVLGKKRITPEEVEQFIQTAKLNHVNINLTTFNTSTSAITGEGVNDAFEELARQVVEIRPVHGSSFSS